MLIQHASSQCQSQCWPQISEGIVSNREIPLWRRAKRVLKRILRQSTKKRVKSAITTISTWAKKSLGGKVEQGAPLPNPGTLNRGDTVRIRSREEIKATLDANNELRGCLFMPAMWRYCGSVQRVLKPVERFVDERDYKVKKIHGIVLLEGLTCSGAPDYGRCDRSCFYFWRQEWLERLH